MTQNNLSLDNVSWRTFKIKKFFEIRGVLGKTISGYNQGKIPYVTTSSQNNGVSDFVDSSDISFKRAISVDPIAGKAFFHDYDFVGRGIYPNTIGKK